MATEQENIESEDTEPENTGSEDIELGEGESSGREFGYQIVTEAASRIADALIEEYGYTDSQLVVLRTYDIIGDRIRARLAEREEEIRRGEGG